jgi:hypothetical protein
MRSRVDARLREEVARFELRYSCEHCAYFVSERGACAHGYPNAEHRLRELTQASELVFCKEFELV